MWKEEKLCKAVVCSHINHVVPHTPYSRCAFYLCCCDFAVMMKLFWLFLVLYCLSLNKKGTKQGIQYGADLVWPNYKWVAICVSVCCDFESEIELGAGEH